MTKHVIDNTKSHNTPERTREFARIDAEEKPHPQTKSLQRRDRTPDGGSRMKAYTDIERRG